MNFFTIISRNCIFLFCFNFLILISCSNTDPNSSVLHKIGEQIRAARIEKGISQEELANAIEMTQSSLSLIEDGLATPVQEKLVAIETYLGVRFEYKEE